MVDTKPLLKGFGALTNVASQIATDKAVNSRRTRSGFSQFDITQGQLLENVKTDDQSRIAHSLGKKPKGAIILFSAAPLSVVTLSDTHLTFDAPNVSATLWVV
jgi:hypothetical protein